jgi:hypothetical protein
MPVSEAKFKMLTFKAHRECSYISLEVFDNKITEEEANKQTTEIGKSLVRKYGLSVALSVFKVIEKAIAKDGQSFVFEKPNPAALKMKNVPETIEKYVPAKVEGIREFFSKFRD